MQNDPMMVLMSFLSLGRDQPDLTTWPADYRPRARA
jgi:hypothetical protein